MLYILSVVMADEPKASSNVSAVGQICLLHLAKLDISILNWLRYHALTKSLQLVGSALDREVGKWNFVWVPVHDGRHAEVVCFHILLRNVKFKITCHLLERLI